MSASILDAFDNFSTTSSASTSASSIHQSQANQPSLFPNELRYYLTNTLLRCHEYKQRYYSFLKNCAFVFGFIFIVGIYLYFNYKGPLSDEERAYKQYHEQEKMLSKIRFFKELEEERMKQYSITGDVFRAWDMC